MRVAPAALIALVLALVGVGTWALVSGRFSDDSKPGGPAARESPGAETPAPTTAHVSPTVAPEAEPTIVYSEFGQDEDTIRLAAVSRLDQPQAIATVAHAPFWGISASLSPDGGSVAYAALPPAVANPEEAADDQAEVWVQPLDGGERRLLAENGDVRVAPIWAPDSGSLVYQSVARESNSQTLSRVNMGDGSVSVLATLGGAAAFPVGFSSDMELFYVSQIGEGATDLLAIKIASGSIRTLSSLPGGVARDWHASPDGINMLFVNRVQDRWEVGVASLPDGTVSALETDALPSGVELFSPIWHPQRPILTVGTAPGGGGTGALDVSLSGDAGERLPGPDQGFDVPLAWSPDGGYLAVQGFSEYPVQRRGSLHVITPEGQRVAPVGQAEVTFVGWLSGSP